MSWGGLQLTRLGQDLNAKILLGQIDLKIVKVAAGDGMLMGSPVNLTNMVNEILSLPITSTKRLPDGTALFSTLLSNEELANGFFFREIGVWAQDPDLGEILYSYDYYGSDPQWIPSGGGATLIKAKYNLGMKIDNALNVIIKLDEDLQFMTRDELINTISQPNGITPLDVTGKVPLAHLPPIDSGGVKSVNGLMPEASGNVEVMAINVRQEDNFSVQWHQEQQEDKLASLIDNLQEQSIDNLILNSIWPELTESTTTARKLYIPQLTSMDQLINRQLFIRALVAGNSGAITLQINDFSPVSLWFADENNQINITTGARTAWIRPNLVYIVAYDGNRFVVSALNYFRADTQAAGLTVHADNLTTDSTNMSLAANQGMAIKGLISENSAQIAIIWDALFNNLTENPFMVTFNNLTGVNLQQGIWNNTAARLEC